MDVLKLIVIIISTFLCLIVFLTCFYNNKVRKQMHFLRRMWHSLSLRWNPNIAGKTIKSISQTGVLCRYRKQSHLLRCTTNLALTVNVLRLSKNYYNEPDKDKNWFSSSCSGLNLEGIFSYFCLRLCIR